MNNKVLYSIVFAILLFSCEEKVRKQISSDANTTQYSSNVEVFKNLLEEEDSLIRNYIQEHNLEMKKTATGLFYHVEPSGMNNKFPIGTFMELDYEIHRLNGDLIYSSAQDDQMKVALHKDHSIKGLVEGIELMKLGKKACFIIPSHLAYGLSGDMQKIKVSEVLIYNIEIKTINNQKIK